MWPLLSWLLFQHQLHGLLVLGFKSVLHKPDLLLSLKRPGSSRCVQKSSSKTRSTSIDHFKWNPAVLRYKCLFIRTCCVRRDGIVSFLCKVSVCSVNVLRRLRKWHYVEVRLGNIAIHRLRLDWMIDSHVKWGSFPLLSLMNFKPEGRAGEERWDEF